MSSLSFETEEPVIIGGFPGSGTRVFCKIIQDNGFFMGTNLNQALDAMYFDDFLLKWALPYLDSTNSKFQLSEMIENFKKTANTHLEKKPESVIRWGFKIPRIILLLPFLHSQFPKMKFLHIIRDGRDLAVSKNPRWRLRQLAPEIIGREALSYNDLLDLWSEINIKAADYGETHLKENYLRIKYEDVCSNPKTISNIFSFLKISQPINESTEVINPTQGTIGRWRVLAREFDELSERSRNSLVRFGYLET